MNRAHMHLPIVCGVLTAMLLTGPVAGQSPLGRIAVGQPFPEIQFARLSDGRAGSPADFKGKRVLLLVFASW